MAKPDRIFPPAKLTKRTVDAAKPMEKDYVLWDQDIHGFGVKVTPKGRKVYLMKFRTHAGVARKPNIGVHGNITAEEARKTAKEWAAEIVKGGDPGQAKAEAREAAAREVEAKAREVTFREAVERYIETDAKPAQRTWRETQRILTVNCKDWLDRPVADITTGDIYTLLDKYVAAGKAPMAKNTLSWLRSMLLWCRSRKLVETSVASDIRYRFDIKPRERFYDHDEIVAIWNAANKLDPMKRGFIKLNVLLGTRARELAGMRRSEFDDPMNPTEWTVPHERTKNKKTASVKRTYYVPIVPLAQRVIRSVPRIHDDLIFPGRSGEKPFVPTTRLRKKIRKLSGISDWMIHSHRDTISTEFQNRGRSEFERGLMLNHAGSGGVTGDYSHGFAKDLKREMCQEWADHVAGLVSPDVEMVS